MSKLNFNSLKMCLVTLKHKNTFISMFLCKLIFSLEIVLFDDTVLVVCFGTVIATLYRVLG